MSETPAGTAPVEGIVNTRSPLPVADTAERLARLIGAAGATLFGVIDQSCEAEQAGLTLRDTKLLIFGNPAAGTPVMAAAPLAALDLPLKILVWQDDDGAVWMAHLDPAWLAARYGLAGDLAAALRAPAVLTARVDD
ncbi:MAG TPA: DUF302 domain-containing protein [Streptosporangiaceae bacterium]